MSKRLANMLEATLPPAPSVTAFLAGLRAWQTAHTAAATNPDPIHGDLFGVPKKPSGSAGAERAGVSLVLHFAQFCEACGATYTTLDAFLTAWAQWVISPAHLFDTEAEQKACEERRKEQAGRRFKCSSLPVGTFRTYLNAVARAYSQSGSPIGGNDVVIVPSSLRQFPNLNATLKPVITRSRATRAVTAAQRPVSEILTTSREGEGTLLRPHYPVYVHSTWCHSTFHLQCANLLRPPRYNSWACEVCLLPPAPAE
jgi:hypothetical protein